MKKFILLIFAALAVCGSARAGNVTTYPNVSAVTDADVFFDWQSSAQQNATGLQLKAYMLGGGSAAISSGKTFTLSNSLTFTGTDGSSVAFGGGGTVLYSTGIGTSIQAYSARLQAISALSNPGGNYALCSTSSGTLFWSAFQPGTVIVTAGGTNTYTATPSPALSAYTSGMIVLCTFTNANTGGSSLNLNSLGAVPILLNGAALTSGQISAGAIGTLIYDGTNFNLVALPPTPAYTLPAATTSSLGGVQVPSAGGLAVDGSGNLSIAGTTQGDILYRGASGWSLLTPGTSGQVLTTGGASANPSWQNGSGGGGGADTIEAANFTATASTVFQVNTSSGAVSVATIASPTAGEWFELQDAGLSWNTHNVTVTYNSTDKINSGTTSYTASVQGNKLRCTYINSTIGWSIK